MKMQNAEMQFVAFDASDVITTSGIDGTVTLANLGNGKSGDFSVTYGGNTYVGEDFNWIYFNNYFIGLYGDVSGDEYQERFPMDLMSLRGWDLEEEFMEEMSGEHNGVYKWIINQKQFVKQ